MTEQATRRRKPRFSKAAREFDEDLFNQVNKIRDIVKEQVQAEIPKCPSCGGNEVYVRTVRNPVAGEKPSYICKNKSCQRHFVSDNDSYKPLFIKMLMWQMFAVGGPAAATRAIQLGQKYGAGIDQSPVMRFMIGARKGRTSF